MKFSNSPTLPQNFRRPRGPNKTAFKFKVPTFLFFEGIFPTFFSFFFFSGDHLPKRFFFFFFFKNFVRRMPLHLERIALSRSPWTLTKGPRVSDDDFFATVVGY